MEELHKFLEFCNRYSWPTHDDEVLSYANEKFPGWIGQFSANEREVILEMINEFSYYSRETVSNNLAELSNVLERDFGIHNNALFTYIKKKNGKICSSIDYWIDFCRKNKIAPEYTSDDLNSFPDEHWSRVDNIVVIDDCCNSGGSLEKYLEECTKSFEGKNLYYVVICAMQDACERVKSIAEDKKSNIVLIAKEIKHKAFSLENIHKLCSAEAFAEYSLALGIPKFFSLGFHNSQSLMAFYNNTPNNTIGIFWYKTPKNEPIFTRRDRAVPLWEIIEAKKSRTEENYNAGKIKGKHE